MSSGLLRPSGLELRAQLVVATLYKSHSVLVQPSGSAESRALLLLTRIM